MAERKKNRNFLMFISILLSTIFSAGYGLSTALMIMKFASASWSAVAIIGITGAVAGIGGIVFLAMTIKPLYNILNKLYPAGGKLFGGYLKTGEKFSLGQKFALGAAVLISLAAGLGFAASAHAFMVSAFAAGILGGAIFPPLLIAGVAVIGIVMAAFVLDGITRLIKSGHYNPFSALRKLKKKFKDKYHKPNLTTQQKVERFITYTIAVILAATIIGLVITSFMYGGPMFAFLYANLGGASAAIVSVASYITAGLYAIGRGLYYLADFNWWTSLGQSIAKIPFFSAAGLTAIIAGAAILAIGISTLGVALAALFGAAAIGFVLRGIVRHFTAKPEPVGQVEQAVNQESDDEAQFSNPPYSRLAEQKADNPDEDYLLVVHGSPLGIHGSDGESEEKIDKISQSNQLVTG